MPMLTASLGTRNPRVVMEMMIRLLSFGSRKRKTSLISAEASLDAVGLSPWSAARMLWVERKRAPNSAAITVEIFFFILGNRLPDFLESNGQSQSSRRGGMEN